MERLNEDEIILIAQKFAAHGTRSLLSFMQTSKYHEKVAKMDVVIRALRPDCLRLCNDPSLTLSKTSFH